MTSSPCDGHNNPPALPLILVEMPPPLACLHCAATQASLRRDRQILAARLGYPADCVCCDCETGHACPRCLGENLEYGSYDYGTGRETGYADSVILLARDGFEAVNYQFQAFLIRLLAQPAIRIGAALKCPLSPRLARRDGRGVNVRAGGLHPPQGRARRAKR
jgi:hypothetical protein